MTTSMKLATTSALALTLALAAAPVLAQDTAAADPMYLGRIIVGYTADGSPIYAGENTSRLEGAAVTAQGGTATVDDVLRQTPGVTTLMNQGQPGVAVAVRGFGGSHVETSIEGVPQNFRFTAHNNADGFAYVDPLLLSSIDVTRGAAVTSGGMAGAVDFRLLTAADMVDGEGWGGLARLRYSTNGEGLAGVLGTAYVNGPLELALAISNRDIEAYENGDGTLLETTAQEGGSLLLRGTYDVSDALRLTFLAMDYNTAYHTKTAGFFPGSFIEYDLDVRNRIYDFGFDYSSGDLVNLTGNFYSGTTTHEHVAGNGSAVTGALGPRVMETTSLGFNARNVSDFTWQGWDVTSTNGLEISRDGLGGNNGGSNPIDGEATRTAFFSENVLTSGALELMLGLRYSTYDLGYEDVSVSADSLDPKVSVAYQVNDWFQPYLSIYRTSRAPTLQEAFLGGDSGASHGGSMYNGNPELRPEVSTGYEIGANITRDGVLTAGDSLTARIAFYDMDVEDFILLSTAAGMQFVNADDTIATRGVEIEIGYESDRFSGVLSWAHTDGEYGAGRIQPEDAVTATLAAHMLDGALTVGTTWTYNSNGPAAIAFETEVDRDAYQVVDLFASYDITDTFSVNAKVSNVADELYTPWAATANSGPGRNIYVGAEFRF